MLVFPDDFVYGAAVYLEFSQTVPLSAPRYCNHRFRHTGILFLGSTVWRQPAATAPVSAVSSRRLFGAISDCTVLCLSLCADAPLDLSVYGHPFLVYPAGLLQPDLHPYRGKQLYLSGDRYQHRNLACCCPIAVRAADPQGGCLCSGAHPQPDGFPKLGSDAAGLPVAEQLCQLLRQYRRRLLFCLAAD